MSNLFSRQNSIFEVDDKNKIVHIKFLGETFSSDIIKANQKLSEVQKTFQGYHVIYDFRKSKPLFNQNKTEAISGTFKIHANIFNQTKIAFIINNINHSQGINSLEAYFHENKINISLIKVMSFKQAITWIKYERLE